MFDQETHKIELECVFRDNKDEMDGSIRKKKKRFSQNVRFVDDLDEEIEPLFSINDIEHDKEIGLDYSKRDFENSNLTKFIHEQILIIKMSMMMMAILSIVLSLMSEIIIE